MGIKKASEVFANTKKSAMELMSNEQMQKVLSTCYEKALNGLPITKSAPDLAADYIVKHTNSKKAAQALVQNQIRKCATSGFVTGFGGFITLPVTIPANIASVLYVQLQMIAAIAIMGGYDPKDDAVQTMAYMCLVGDTVKGVLKQTGIQASNKFLLSTLKKLPGSVLTKINQRVGFRLLTKFGEKGVVNLWKVVPVAGAVVGGSIDAISTKSVGNRAIKMFIYVTPTPET